MKWIMLMIAFSALLLPSGMGQPDQYSINTTTSAPTPTNPTTPESIGLQIPSVTVSQQAPTLQELSQGLAATNQQAAYAAAPQGLAATATAPTYAQAIAPTGAYLTNGLYVAYAPQTVAGCNLYANLPLWMNTVSSGDIWFYEWYPNGKLNTQYAGHTNYPGWYKRWFYADVPGWHTLQYYCSGWSNYAYIYVYGQVNPTPPENPEKIECEQKPYCDWINGQCLCTGYNPEPDPATECEKNPTCNWVNGQCLCTGYNPKPDPAMECEKNPTCNWVNGQCLCTGYNPTSHATGLNPTT